MPIVMGISSSPATKQGAKRLQSATANAQLPGSPEAVSI